MDKSEYVANGNNVATLISKNIYDPINAIVEEAANFYDADSTEVKINFKESNIDNVTYITEITIEGDGEGFSLDDLNTINELVNSKKIENLYTKKYNRIKLGSFGIAFTSFQCLGNEIDIYSKVNSNEVLYKNILLKNGKPVFSNIKKLHDCNIIQYETGCTLIIKNCKILKTVFMGYTKNNLDTDLLNNKLAYLPLSDNFKITLCGKTIKRFIIDNEAYNIKINFNIDNIKFDGTIYYSATNIKNVNFCGVFLKIDERIIDWNIFNDIRKYVTSPGSVEHRIHGYISANGLRDKINASRNGLTDKNLSINISMMLKNSIGSIHKKAKKYYKWDKDLKKNNLNKKDETTDNNSEKLDIIEYKESYNANQRKEKTKKRLKNPNKYLKKLGINFCYEPENEGELIIITSQMLQKKIIRFSNHRIK